MTHNYPNKIFQQPNRFDLKEGEGEGEMSNISLKISGKARDLFPEKVIATLLWRKIIAHSSFLYGILVGIAYRLTVEYNTLIWTNRK